MPKLKPHDDKLKAIYLLKENNYSWRAIGRLFGHHVNTVKGMYFKYIEKYYRGDVHTSNTYETNKIQISYIGGTNEIESIERQQIEKRHGR